MMTMGQRLSLIALCFFGAWLAIGAIVVHVTDDEGGDVSLYEYQNDPDNYPTCHRLISRQHLDHPMGWARCTDETGDVIDLQDDPRFRG